MAMIIFSSLPCPNPYQSNQIRWFVTEKGYTQNASLIKFYPPGSLVLVPDCVTSIDDVISDSVSYLNSAIQTALPEYILLNGIQKNCYNQSHCNLAVEKRLYR